MGDFRRLGDRDRALFLRAVRELNTAYARSPEGRSPRWPSRLRVKKVSDSGRVWEMTWSFAGPDGRATFEFFETGGEQGIRWRRLGGHEILQDP